MPSFYSLNQRSLPSEILVSRTHLCSFIEAVDALTKAQTNEEKKNAVKAVTQTGHALCLSNIIPNPTNHQRLHNPDMRPMQPQTFLAVKNLLIENSIDDALEHLIKLREIDRNTKPVLPTATIQSHKETMTQENHIARLLLDGHGKGWKDHRNIDEPMSIIHQDGTILRIHNMKREWRISCANCANKTVLYLPFKSRTPNIIDRLEKAFCPKGQTKIRYWKQKLLGFLLAQDAEPGWWCWDANTKIPYHIGYNAFAGFYMDPSFYSDAKTLSQYAIEVPNNVRGVSIPILQPANILYVECPTSAHARLDAKMQYNP